MMNRTNGATAWSTELHCVHLGSDLLRNVVMNISLVKYCSAIMMNRTEIRLMQQFGSICTCVSITMPCWCKTETVRF